MNCMRAKKRQEEQYPLISVIPMCLESWTHDVLVLVLVMIVEDF